MKKTPKEIKKRLAKAKTKRVNWDNQWQEIADYMMPDKNDIIVKRMPGEKRNVQILDGTGMRSLELLAGALHGMLTNPNSFFFGMSTGDTELDNSDNVRKFLQKTTKDIHNELNNSNFQTEVHELYMGLVGFGTGVTDVLESDDDNVASCVWFQTHMINNCWIYEDGRGRVNELYREFQWTARQIATEFGSANFTGKLKTAFEKDDDCLFTVVHSVCQTANDKSNPKPVEFKYYAQFITVEDEVDLKEEGFYEFPYLTPRWTKQSGSAYGGSPAQNALPDVKMQNKMKEVTIKSGQLTIAPPVQMPDDGFALPVKFKPFGINYYRAGSQDRIEPLLKDVRVDFGFQMLDATKKDIREAFYVDQLKLQEGQEMTATEVLQRTEEAVRLLGPMLGRQQSEFLAPLINRVFNIMLRRGKIKRDEIPQELLGRDIIVQYSSLIAKAQQIAEAQNILRTIQTCEPFITLDPTIQDNWDGDKVFRIVGGIFGFPQPAIRDVEERDAIRQARAKAAAEQQNAQMQAQTVETASKAAQSLQKVGT